MSIYRRWDYSSEKREYSISEAVSHQIAAYREGGTLETVEVTLSNCSRFVAELFELLHKKGLVSTTEVLDIIGGFEEET